MKILDKKTNVNNSLPKRIDNDLQVTTISDLETLSRYAAEANLVIKKRNSHIPNERTNPSYAFMIMKMAMEIGLKPMQGLLNISIINDRPTLWGDAMLALVRQSGLLDKFIERFEGEEFNDSYKATCSLKRKGYDPISYEFSVRDAKRANLWKVGTIDFRGKSSPWYKYPKRMLQMRARSWALRDTFTDILMGFSTTEEEMDIHQNYTAVNSDYKEEAITVTPKEIHSTTPKEEEPIEYSLLEGIDNEEDKKLIKEYISTIAETTNRSKKDVISRISQNAEGFLSMFFSWKKKREQAELRREKTEVKE